MTRIYMNYDMFRHRAELCDMMHFRKTEKGGDSNAEEKKSFGESKKVVVKLARETASVEANTVCAGIYYQPKETESVKQLRKF